MPLLEKPSDQCNQLFAFAREALFIVWTVPLLEKPSDGGISCLLLLEKPSVQSMDCAFAREAI